MFSFAVAMCIGCAQQPNTAVRSRSSTNTEQKIGIPLVQSADGKYYEVSCVARVANGQGSMSDCPPQSPIESTKGTSTANTLGRGCCSNTSDNWYNNYGASNNQYQRYYVVYDPTQIPTTSACGAAGVYNCNNFYTQLGYNYINYAYNSAPVYNNGTNYQNFSYGTNYNNCNQWWKFYWFN